VIRGRNSPLNIIVVPGPDVADPDVTTPPPAQGGGTGAPSPANPLASTGVSVLWLSLLGGLAVAFGIGARVFGRRKRTDV
jgi:LPXTG-motif cell wall-anchored protein